MTLSVQELNDLGFSDTHSISVSHDGALKFTSVRGRKTPETPCVYLWVALPVDTEQAEILYVGKAGKGVARRCSQHQSGFVNSRTGKKNAAALKQVLARAKVIVMSRESGAMEIFGQKVSLYAVEEDALCALLLPKINRAAFPGISSFAVIESAEIVLVSDDLHLASIADLTVRRFVQHEQGTYDDMMAQIDAYSPDQRALVCEMLEFVEKYIVTEQHSSKLVKGYTNQIDGCNRVTALVFGDLAAANIRPKQWVARLFLSDPPRIVFPKRLMKVAAADKVEKSEDSFSPINMNDFFRAPADYLIFPSQIRPDAPS